MSEITSHIPTKKSSPKSFGIVFSIVFLTVALYPLINFEGLRIWALVVSAIFLIGINDWNKQIKSNFDPPIYQFKSKQYLARSFNKKYDKCDKS